MKLPLRRQAVASKGQALAEFAVIVPAFLMLLFGMVDFGRAYSVSVTLTNAVREGARYGVTNPSDSPGIVSRATSTAAPYNDSSLTVTTSCVTPAGATGATCTTGNSVVVNASYAFSFITPLSAIVHLASGGTLSGTMTLKSSANMRIE